MNLTFKNIKFLYGEGGIKIGVASTFSVFKSINFRGWALLFMSFFCSFLHSGLGASYAGTVKHHNVCK